MCNVGVLTSKVKLLSSPSDSAMLCTTGTLSLVNSCRTCPCSISTPNLATRRGETSEWTPLGMSKRPCLRCTLTQPTVCAEHMLSVTLFFSLLSLVCRQKL